MSRIYDAIRMARETRAQGGLDTSDSLGEMELPDRRITPRRDLDIDLTVYGQSMHETFYEKARAISGNVNGGVIVLGVPVVEGQDVLLINNGTSMEQICSVIGVRIVGISTCEVSVSFPVPNPDFWKGSGAAQAGGRMQDRAAGG